MHRAIGGIQFPNVHNVFLPDLIRFGSWNGDLKMIIQRMVSSCVEILLDSIVDIGVPFGNLSLIRKETTSSRAIIVSKYLEFV